MPLLYGDSGIISARYRQGDVGAGYKPRVISPSMGRLSPYSGYSFGAVRSLFGGGRERERQPMQGPVRQPFGSRMSSGFMRGPVASQATAYAPKRLWNYSFAGLAPAHTTLGRMRAASGMGMMRSSMPKYTTWT